jgi:hypothetical protein
MGAHLTRHVPAAPFLGCCLARAFPHLYRFRKANSLVGSATQIRLTRGVYTPVGPKQPLKQGGQQEPGASERRAQCADRPGKVCTLEADHLCSPSLGQFGFQRKIIPAHGGGVQCATEPQEVVNGRGPCSEKVTIDFCIKCRCQV